MAEEKRSLNISAIIFLVLVVLATVYFRGIPLYGLLLGIVMFLLISKLGESVGIKLLRFDFNSFRLSQKLGSKEAIILKESYKKTGRGFFGALDTSMKITWVTFGATLLLMRYILENIANVLHNASEISLNVILFMILVGLLGSLLSPLSVPMWVISSSRVRIFDTRGIYLLPPGSKVRSVLRGLFGVGNLAVIVYTLWSLASSAQGGIINGLVLGFLIIAITFAAVGLGAILAAVLIMWKKTGLFDSILDKYESWYREVAISSEDFITIITDAVELEVGAKKEEEMIEEKPVEETTETPGEKPIEGEEISTKEATEAPSEEAPTEGEAPTEEAAQTTPSTSEETSTEKEETEEVSEEAEESESTEEAPSGDSSSS